jgi:hypothetical protein
MRRRLSSSLALVAAVVAVSGCGSTTTVTVTVTTAGPASGGLGSPGRIPEFGYLKSLTLRSGRFVLRFDPAWLLSGVTANTAAAEDGVVGPGLPVPNDNYTVDEGHRLLTYRVAPNARVTVLTNHGNPGRLGATPISVSQLAQIVAGRSRLKLSEPISTGFWIVVDVDTVRSFAQQYRP